MKNKKYILTLLLLNAVCWLFAQTNNRTQGARNRATTTRPANVAPAQAVDTTPITPEVNTTINAVAPSLNVDANNPTIAQSLLSLMDTISKSLRDDNVVPGSDINIIKKPLPYPRILGNDVAWKQRVWEEIDVRQKINLPFSSDRSVDDQNTITFIDVLFEGIRQGAFKVFTDEKFTQYVTDAEIVKIVQGEPDTTEVPDATDPRGLRKIKKITYNKLNPSDIKKYRLKEEWLFDKKTSRLVYRIIGLAPLKTIVNPETGIELGQQPLFWLYYPDCRDFIATYAVPSFKNYAQKMSWNQILEMRFFNGTIIKSTIDNPRGRRISEYIKDPYLRLLEGETVRTKIFDYEQSLWAY